MPSEIDCFFTLGSTYSYLTVVRAPEVSRTFGVEVRLRPFHLLQIFKEMDYFPFPPDAPKTRYMWQDLARRAGLYGIPLNLPIKYPAANSIVANKIALVGLRVSFGMQNCLPHCLIQNVTLRQLLPAVVQAEGEASRRG